MRIWMLESTILILQRFELRMAMYFHSVLTDMDCSCVISISFERNTKRQLSIANTGAPNQSSWMVTTFLQFPTNTDKKPARTSPGDRNPSHLGSL